MGRVRAGLVDGKRARQFPVRFDLLLQERDLLLCGAEGVSAGEVGDAARGEMRIALLQQAKSRRA